MILEARSDWAGRWTIDGDARPVVKPPPIATSTHKQSSKNWLRKICIGLNIWNLNSKMSSSHMIWRSRREQNVKDLWKILPKNKQQQTVRDTIYTGQRRNGHNENHTVSSQLYNGKIPTCNQRLTQKLKISKQV